MFAISKISTRTFVSQEPQNPTETLAPYATSRRKLPLTSGATFERKLGLRGRLKGDEGTCATQPHKKDTAGVPDGAARLKPRSAGWIRARWELNTLDGSWLKRF